MRKILITGSEGFIGSNMVKYWTDKYPDDTIIRVDAITYAARTPLVDKSKTSKHFFYKINIAEEFYELKSLIDMHAPDMILHYAAESHVCNSISDPYNFLQANIVGTFNVLEAVRQSKNKPGIIHISTDEVFGELTKDDGKFNEHTQIKPRSPYSATKASSDLLALAWHQTYGMDIVVTNSSNVYGPNQHEEKLIPKTITKILNNETMTLYGPGTQIRDWVYVLDHCRAIDTLVRARIPGERYLIGGDLEIQNVDMVKLIFHLMQKIYPQKNLKLNIIHTNDRPTDDFRYAIDCSKIKGLGWHPTKERLYLNLLDTIKSYEI